MNRSIARFLPAVMLLVPSLVQAHTHKSIMGTVKAIDATHIELTLKDGKTQSIPLAKSTMVMRGKDMVGMDQVKPGMRVVVVLAEDDKTAENIKLGAESKKK